MTTIVKKEVQAYEIHTEAGDCALVVLETAPQFLRVMAHGSYGTFAYTWTAPGDNPLDFMSEIDFDYAMSKLRGDFMVLCKESQSEDFFKKIKSMRKNGELSKEEARELSEEFSSILEDSDGKHEFYNNLMSHQTLCDFFQDYDKDFKLMPEGNCVGFWNDIWCPLIKSLKETKSIST